jgi:hypothetical protein
LLFGSLGAAGAGSLAARIRPATVETVNQAGEIKERFERNLERVGGIVGVFGAAGPPTENVDILRAAVVFLHATLEELLRASVWLLLPRATSRAYERMMFVPRGAGEGRNEKLDLTQLADYRGQTVDEVLERAIEFHLEHSNYNNPTEVMGTLERLGVVNKPPSALLGDLGAMMTRRHLIVHRTDTARGGRDTQTLAKEVVLRWMQCVREFGEHVLAELRVATKEGVQ